MTPKQSRAMTVVVWGGGPAALGYVLNGNASCDIVISFREIAMAQLVVRNIEEEVKARLQRRATSHARSMEEEVRDILRNAVKDDDRPSPRLGSRLRKRFSAIGLDEDIPELRGTTAIPAPFDE